MVYSQAKKKKKKESHFEVINLNLKLCYYLYYIE